MSTLVEYLEARIDFGEDPGGCWTWTAAVKPNGYGSGRHRTTGTFNAHRMVYRVLVGEVPEGLDLDHLCRVRACVNPAHLEPVTRRENLVRGETLVAAQLAKATCPRGHPYDKRRGGYRACSRCDREAVRRANARRRR